MAQPEKKEITADMFRPATVQVEEKEEITTEAMSYGRDSMRRLVRDQPASSSALIILLITVMAFVGPHVSEWAVDDQDLTRSSGPPEGTPLSKSSLFNGLSSDGADRHAERQIEDN